MVVGFASWFVNEEVYSLGQWAVSVIIYTCYQVKGVRLPGMLLGHTRHPYKQSVILISNL